MIKIILTALLMFSSANAAVAGYGADIKAAGQEDDLARYEEEYLRKVDANGLRVIDKLNYEPSPDPVLTMAEQVAIAYYTISYQMDHRIMLAGAQKLGKKAGLFFRGEMIGGRVNITHTGQTLNLEGIVSVSTNRSVAEGFLPGPDNSELLIIKARSARDISSYSQCHIEGVDEKEHFLLPGTALVVDKIYWGVAAFPDETTGADVMRQIRFVELHEADLR